MTTVDESNCNTGSQVLVLEYPEEKNVGDVSEVPKRRRRGRRGGRHNKKTKTAWVPPTVNSDGVEQSSTLLINQGNNQSVEDLDSEDETQDGGAEDSQACKNSSCCNLGSCRAETVDTDTETDES